MERITPPSKVLPRVEAEPITQQEPTQSKGDILKNNLTEREQLILDFLERNVDVSYRKINPLFKRLPPTDPAKMAEIKRLLIKLSSPSEPDPSEVLINELKAPRGLAGEEIAIDPKALEPAK